MLDEGVEVLCVFFFVWGMDGDRLTRRRTLQSAHRSDVRMTRLAQEEGGHGSFFSLFDRG